MQFITVSIFVFRLKKMCKSLSRSQVIFGQIKQQSISETWLIKGLKIVYKEQGRGKLRSFNFKKFYWLDGRVIEWLSFFLYLSKTQRLHPGCVSLFDQKSQMKCFHGYCKMWTITWWKFISNFYTVLLILARLRDPFCDCDKDCVHNSRR